MFMPHFESSAKGMHRTVYLHNNAETNNRTVAVSFVTSNIPVWFGWYNLISDSCLGMNFPQMTPLRMNRACYSAGVAEGVVIWGTKEIFAH